MLSLSDREAPVPQAFRLRKSPGLFGAGDSAGLTVYGVKTEDDSRILKGPKIFYCEVPLWSAATSVAAFPRKCTTVASLKGKTAIARWR